MSTSFPIRKSFLCDEALAHSIEAAYGLSDVHCQLMTASMRDVYLVTSDETRWVLYVYRCDQRTPAEISAEWKFVDFLYTNGIPVAPAVPKRSDELLMTFDAPEGTRHGVLTPFVDGKHLRQRPNLGAVRTYGRLVAQIHALADILPFGLARSTNDWETLVNQSVVARNVSMTLRQLSLDFSVRTCVAGDVWRLAEPVGADLGETRRNLRIGLSL